MEDSEKGKCDMLSQEGELIAQIGKLLKPFSEEQQKRILGAVAVLCGIANAEMRV